MDDDETLLVKPEVFLYKIPPSIQKKEGYIHRASDWDIGNPGWYGRLTIFAAGPTCHVMLEDRKGDVFGQAVLEDYPGKVLNNVFDSSRYFVLTIQTKSGDFEKVGIGFSDRKDSADLKSVLKNYFSSVNPAVKRPAAPDASSGDSPSKKIRIAEVKPEPKQPPAPEVSADDIAKPASTLKAATGAAAIPVTTVANVKAVPAETTAIATATSQSTTSADPLSNPTSKDLNEGSSTLLTVNKIPLVPAEKLVAKKAVVFAQPSAAKPKAPPPPKISKPPMTSVLSQSGLEKAPSSPHLPPDKGLTVNKAKPVSNTPSAPKVQSTITNKVPEKTQSPVVSRTLAQPKQEMTRSSSATEPLKTVEAVAKTVVPPPPTILKVPPLAASSPSTSVQHSQPLKSILKKSHGSIQAAPTVAPPVVMAAPSKVPLVPYSEGVSLVPYDEKASESAPIEEMKMSVDEETEVNEGKVLTSVEEAAKSSRDSTTPRSARKIVAEGQSPHYTTASITDSVTDSNTEIHTAAEVVKHVEAEVVFATPISITPDNDQRTQENPLVSDPRADSIQQDEGLAAQAVLESKNTVDVSANIDCESSGMKEPENVLDNLNQVVLAANASEIDQRSSEEPDEKSATVTEIPPTQLESTDESLIEKQEAVSNEPSEALAAGTQPETEHEIVKTGNMTCSAEEPLLLKKSQQETLVGDNQEQGNAEVPTVDQDIDLGKDDEESHPQKEDSDAGEQHLNRQVAAVEQNGEQDGQKDETEDEGRDGMEQEQEQHVDQDGRQHLNEGGENVDEVEEHNEGEEYVDEGGHGEGECSEVVQGAAVDAEGVGEGDQEYAEGGEEYVEGQEGEEYVEGGEEYVQGEGGEEHFEGEEGEEYVEGDGGEGYAEGEGGEEYVEGEGEEYIEGEGGEEYIEGEGGEEYIEGEGGEEYVEGEGGEEYVEGEGGEQRVEGEGGEQFAGDENLAGISEEPLGPEEASDLSDINMVADDANMGDVETLEAAVDVFDEALETQEGVDASENQETIQTDENLDETVTGELPSDSIQR